MGLFDAIFLGLLQGLTEFLPVSSSGHLVIAQSLMKNFKEPGLLFDTLLHLATFCAVIIYFRHKVAILLKSLLGLFAYKYRLTYYDNKRFLWAVIISCIPTCIIGLAVKPYADTLFSAPVFAGYGLIITSVLLVISDKFNGRYPVDTAKGFWVGVVQGIAVMPGISRSGSTIAASLILGIKREDAVEFSFLMALPAVFGAALLQIRHIESIAGENISYYLIASLVAFVSAFFAIHFMIQFVKKASLKYFALYCLIVGIITVVWL